MPWLLLVLLTGCDPADLPDDGETDDSESEVESDIETDAEPDTDDSDPPDTDDTIDSDPPDSGPAPCVPPWLPTLTTLRPTDTLPVPDGAEAAALPADDEPATATFAPGPLALTGLSGPARVLARWTDGLCDATYEHTLTVADAAPTDDWVARDDARLVGWAATATLQAGTDVTPAWQVPERATGAATGQSGDVCVLGDGGTLTLTFAPPITDGEGPDLAVFENSFSDTFLELAWVEVSSDGTHFVAFDSAGWQTASVDAFGSVNAADLSGLAGRHRAGRGTLFDLALLAQHPDVTAGAVDLGRITHVRLIDVVGDGTARDSLGRTLYDPHPTQVTAGFDADGVGALHLAAP